MTDRALKPWPFTPAPQLVADIGGTNTRVALADNGVLRSGSIRRYANAGRACLDDILIDYLNSTSTPECAGICIAIAGTVRDNTARMINLDWEVHASDLSKIGKTQHVAILNDLQAQGHALKSLQPRHLQTLLPGPKPADRATQLAVGAGTGFNAAPVYHLPNGTFVAPSEFGHSHLPQVNAHEQALARELAEKHGIASIEEVLCGRGFVALHHWLHGETCEGPDIISRISTRDPSAVETGAFYSRVMGHVLGSLAITHLPYGGIYLIGGMARAMAPHMVELGLRDAFLELGRLSHLMNDFSVHVVEDDYAALLGCASYLTELSR